MPSVCKCLPPEGEANLTKKCSHGLRTFKLSIAQASDAQRALEVVKLRAVL